MRYAGPGCGSSVSWCELAVFAEGKEIVTVQTAAATKQAAFAQLGTNRSRSTLALLTD